MNDTRWLTPLRLRRRLGIENTTLTEGDTARLESALRAAQAEIETATGRRYAPVRAVVSHFALAAQDVLPLRDDLLELVSVQDSDGVVYLPAATTWNAGSLSLNAPYAFAGGEVKVTGLWVYHPAPGLAFRDSSDALASSVTSGATSFTVSDAAGDDPWGEAPRFTAGQLIRIESELIRIASVSGNTLTVRRGENGTTAAAHSSGALIETYAAGYAVESLGLRLASWLYREADGEHGREYPRGIERGIERLRRHTA